MIDIFLTIFVSNLIHNSLSILLPGLSGAIVAYAWLVILAKAKEIFRI